MATEIIRVTTRHKPPDTVTKGHASRTTVEEALEQRNGVHWTEDYLIITSRKHTCILSQEKRKPSQYLMETITETAHASISFGFGGNTVH